MTNEQGEALAVAMGYSEAELTRGLLTPHEIHAMLLIEAMRRDLPQAYKDDVIKHDYTTLVSSKTQYFVWLLRESGSDLAVLDSDKPQHEHMRAILKTYAGYADARWYLFADGRLIACSYEAIKCLVLSR